MIILLLQIIILIAIVSIVITIFNRTLMNFRRIALISLFSLFISVNIISIKNIQIEELIRENKELKIYIQKKDIKENIKKDFYFDKEGKYEKI